ncbi:hypothetical protein V7139_29685 [Neobacillus drentensis]|uniref:hypothetical protein n=1 Tax=Neobacillus drentensis TaxID=220684 RepID=UPI003001CE2B
MDYLGENFSREQMTLEVFLDWGDSMLNDKGLQPTTVNIRIRTMIAFLRWCYLEKPIDTPIMSGLNQ